METALQPRQSAFILHQALTEMKEIPPSRHHYYYVFSASVSITKSSAHFLFVDTSDSRIKEI